MKKLYDVFLWMLVYLKTGVKAILTYPLFVWRNLWYHLTAPSVFFYASAFFVADRLSKLIIISYRSSLPVKLVQEFFTLRFVTNPGVAFGWFPNWRLPPIIMALVMILIIAYYSYQLSDKEKLTRLSLALLVGGAIGNLYDRIVYGHVIDFFSFHFRTFDFPVFNVADIAIDVGVALLFIDIFFLSTDEDQTDGNESDPTPMLA